MATRRRRVSECLSLSQEDVYNRIRVIGNGSFSTVWLATKASSEGHEFVVKDVALESMSDQDRESAISEVVLHSKLDHVNIIKYVEVIRTNPAQLSIVLEYAAAGDIAAFLSTRRLMRQPLSERESLVWFAQLVSAVDYIHKQGMIHRDIKAANVFLATSGLVKLGDFNLSKTLDCNAKRMNERTCSTPCGTPMYNSPEQWLRQPYTQQVDIWALGCLLYELVTVQPAFLADSMEALHKAIHTGKYDRQALRGVGTGVRDMIVSMLSFESRRRPTISELLKNKVVSDMRGCTFLPVELGGSGVVQQLQTVTLLPGRRRSSIPATIEEEPAYEARADLRGSPAPSAPPSTPSSGLRRLPSLGRRASHQHGAVHHRMQRLTLTEEELVPASLSPSPEPAPISSRASTSTTTTHSLPAAHSLPTLRPRKLPQAPDSNVAFPPITVSHSKNPRSSIVRTEQTTAVSASRTPQTHTVG